MPALENKNLSVIFLMRKPQSGYHSFERVFGYIRQAMPEHVHVRVVHSWFHSNGFFKRLLNLLQVLFLRADVYHITGDVHYLALGLIGRRVVLTIHDMAPLQNKHGFSRWIFLKLWYTWPMRIASVTTAISEATKRELVEEAGADPDAIRVIPVCISPEFTYSPKPWPEPPEKPVVLMVGTRPQKNIERMVRALRGMDVVVRIIGQLSRVQWEVLDKTGVTYEELGLLSDAAVVQAYRSCDLLAFASTYEGFGMPIIEAQATGRPVLTSNRPPMSEIAGEGTVLVDPEDVISMGAGLFNLLNDEHLRGKLLDLGRDNALKYTPGAACRRFLEHYMAIK